MKIKIILVALFYSQLLVVSSQTLLEADGLGNTYELISSVLAPGNDAVEEPDCSHLSFGRHIDEVFDVDLNKYVFRFHIHKSPDNDRCLYFDRQRNEIKTYDQSPDSLLAIEGEKVNYSWKFKLDSAFQSSASFTHLHQIKAVGGPEASMLLMTLTARKGSPDKLQLRYADTLVQSTIHQVELAPFKGQWVAVEETILCGELDAGEYTILIKTIPGGDTLLIYSNDSIRTWKTGASFLRPKWGVYRSLNDSVNLRDERVLFADIGIEELNPSFASSGSDVFLNKTILFPNPTRNKVTLSKEVLAACDRVRIYDCYGELVLNRELNSNDLNISELKCGVYFVVFEKQGVSSAQVKIVKE